MEAINLVYIGLLALMICLALTVLLLLVYSGLFYSIEVGAGNPPIADVVVAYKHAKGPYKQCGSMFTELMILAPDNKALGIYYDSPHEKDQSQLRYIVGSVLTEGDQPMDESLKAKMIEEGYSIAKFPAVSNAVKASFPMKSTISIYIAVARAYPKLNSYITENKLCAHPFVEIYDGETINFMAPLSKQEEFYVPEVKIASDESFVSETCTDADFSGLIDVTQDSMSMDNSGSEGQAPNSLPIVSSLTPEIFEKEKITKERDASNSMNDSGVSSENPQNADTSFDGLDKGPSCLPEIPSDNSEGSSSSFEEIHLDHPTSNIL